MSERLMGLETEYALSAIGRGATALDREVTVRCFVDRVRAQGPYLPGHRSSGIFQANGGRFYIDCGLHPEQCTPECSSPSELVRYVLAGERVLARAAAELEAAHREVDELHLTKCNVDYSGTGSTWACHESYLHTSHPGSLPTQLIPHLVSRIVYTGAGGFGAFSHGGGFTVSPRVVHLVNHISGDSTSNRGIFHTKNEPLCDSGHHRLHLLCGESLCSEAATYLKVGTTALVLAMAEAGLKPGNDVCLHGPLEAMRRFARDETCTVKARAANGHHLSAIEIQRHYLEFAERHADRDFMPPWTGDVTARWRAMLDRLAAGAPDSVATVLDWAIKLALYRRQVLRRGLRWGSSLPVGVGQQLCEMDTRFGQLGERGIFAAMDRAGVLDHHLPEVDRIDEAMVEPPALGRARLRGLWVKRLSDKPARSRCDWSSVTDAQHRRLLDLSDPFETEERWTSRDDLSRRSLRHPARHERQARVPRVLQSPRAEVPDPARPQAPSSEEPTPF